MAQLDNFSGGLNTRLAPHLINISEAQIYTNIDNSTGSLKPINDSTNENVVIGKYFINFKNAWVSSNTYKNYIKFQERLYYTDNIGKPQKSTDGINWQNLGIDKPSITPTISLDGSGILTGTYSYCYTYYNSVDGTESQPSTYSSNIVASSNTISIAYTASSDTQVDTIRIYRLGGNLTKMTLVVEVSNSTSSYADNIGDLNVNGYVLDSFNYAPAPTGLSYLTESNAMFFGTIGSKLYYSAVGYVNYWSAFNFIEFNDTLTGIGAVGNGLLVFTKSRTYIVSGTSPSTLSRYLLSAGQGCIAHKSIAFARNTLVWVSKEGICASSGGLITIVSRLKLATLNISSINDAEVCDGVYYVAYNGAILAYDTRFAISSRVTSQNEGEVFKIINQNVDSFSNLLHNDTLYYSLNGRLYSLLTSSTPMVLTYKSPRISDGQISNLKNYKTVYVRCFGSLIIKIYIGGILVATRSIDENTSEILIPSESRLGYYIEFEITGTGELLELQYIVEGRQNGR